MATTELEMERLGRAVTSARARLGKFEFENSGQQGNLVEQARLKREVDQANAAFRQGRRARPLIRRFETWVGDFASALIQSWFSPRGGNSGL